MPPHSRGNRARSQPTCSERTFFRRRRACRWFFFYKRFPPSRPEKLPDASRPLEQDRFPAAPPEPSGNVYSLLRALYAHVLTSFAAGEKKKEAPSPSRESGPVAGPLGGGGGCLSRLSHVVAPDSGFGRVRRQRTAAARPIRESSSTPFPTGNVAGPAAVF